MSDPRFRPLATALTLRDAQLAVEALRYAAKRAADRRDRAKTTDAHHSADAEAASLDRVADWIQTQAACPDC
jgi:hypothetical protein